MERQHIVKKFDKDLDRIKTAILEMGALVGQQLLDATTLLSRFDPDEVERIVVLDRTVNGFHKDIHDRAEILIARRQPMAQDLRQALAPINIAGELERIGDHAKSTAKRARIFNDNTPSPEILSLVNESGEIVRGMLADVMIAYDNGDIDLAARIRAQDDQVDAQNKKLVKAVIATVPQRPEITEALVHLVLVSRNFERVGDHVANIARYVHQIATGEDLKAS